MASFRWPESIGAMCEATGAAENWETDDAGHIVDADRLAHVVRRAFDSIICFHGSRVANPERFLVEGILLYGAEEMKNRARAVAALFCPVPAAATLECAIDRVPLETRAGQVHVGISSSWILDHCGHYLLYGSEYVRAVACRLSEIAGVDYAIQLRSMGCPLFIEIALPSSELGDGKLAQLAEKCWTDAEFRDDDHTISLQSPIPPLWITGISYPNPIRDPYTRELVELRVRE